MDYLLQHLRWFKSWKDFEYKERPRKKCIASSCAKEFINFSACAGECLLKNQEQYF